MYVCMYVRYVYGEQHCGMAMLLYYAYAHMYVLYMQVCIVSYVCVVYPRIYVCMYSIGGMQTSTWVLQCSCKRTGGLKTPETR